MFVLDASVTLCWFLPCSTEQAEYAAAVFDALSRDADSLAVVPDLWHSEVAHVLLRAYRSRELKSAALDRATGVLAELANKRLVTVRSQADATQLLALSREYHLQVYDTVYFHLAKQRSLPMATVDDGLKAAAHRHNVSLLKTHVSLKN